MKMRLTPPNFSEVRDWTDRNTMIVDEMSLMDTTVRRLIDI